MYRALKLSRLIGCALLLMAAGKAFADLPDPLVMADGRKVASAQMWAKERRPELLRLFEQNVYGVSPAAPRHMRFVVTESDAHALEGLATRKQVRIYFEGTETGPQTEVLIYLPNAVPKAPVFVGLNFHGNQAVTTDPKVHIATSWSVKATGIVKGRATTASRGIHASEWPIEDILKSGYGVATIFSGDLYPDSDTGFAESLQPWYRTQASDPSHWGALASWAWGLSRVYDYLKTDQAVDAGRIIVMGHSRYGKASLWAGAADTRFAMVIANDSGEGGASLFRRDIGETIADLPPYWFAPRFKTFAGRSGDLPVDQHELIALVAPRPVYIASATEDAWADPPGEFLAAKRADPVYRLFGYGIDITDMPPPDTPSFGRIGYHLRTGPHALTRYDWRQFIRFADLHLGARP